MGISWEIHGKFMGNSWEYHGAHKFFTSNSMDQKKNGGRRENDRRSLISSHGYRVGYIQLSPVSGPGKSVHGFNSRNNLDCIDTSQKKKRRLVYTSYGDFLIYAYIYIYDMTWRGIT